MGVQLIDGGKSPVPGTEFVASRKKLNVGEILEVYSSRKKAMLVVVVLRDSRMGSMTWNYQYQYLVQVLDELR